MDKVVARALRPGALVVANDNYPRVSLTKGKEYPVLRVMEEAGVVYIRLLCDDDKERWVLPERFEKEPAQGHDGDVAPMPKQPIPERIIHAYVYAAGALAIITNRENPAGYGGPLFEDYQNGDIVRVKQVIGNHPGAVRIQHEANANSIIQSISVDNLIPLTKSQGIYSIYVTGRRAGLRAPVKTRPGEVEAYAAKQYAAFLRENRVKEAPKPAKDKGKELRELLKVEKAEMEKECGKNAGTCSYFLISTDGKVKRQYRDVCHARLWMEKPYAAVLNVSGHYVGMTKEQQDAYKAFLHGLFNESAWAAAFKTKDVEEALKNGVELDVSQPRNIVYSAAIAMRGFSEFKQQRDGWVKMWRNDQLTFMQKWVLCLLFQENGAGSWVYTGTTNAHRTWSSVHTHDPIKKFVNQGFPEKELKGAKFDGSMGCCETALRGGPGLYDGVITDGLIYKHKAVKVEKKGFSAVHLFKDPVAIIKELF